LETFFSQNLEIFAREVVWFMTAEKALSNMDFFLVHLMAKNPQAGYPHFRKYFPQFTDADFIKALKNAPPGIFLDVESWTKWNIRFGLIPPLPFPKKYS
jgi:hypothetical protein